ncbi:unnamed protein product [Blepharisma stoltei]|uniref:Receptor ligand binding region domain-containing protein n=1 Tax=Blepharisma stoltei TaxID=1481888 RepID=A0AAU9I8E5_9CILI|nr:unnamed protein product [Blepharisma stoltei]
MDGYWLYYTLRYFNYSMPHISPYAPSSVTENYTAFPEFMTVIKDVAFNTQVILNLAVIFGWKNFVVIYDNASTVMYNYFVAQLKKFNMRIVNPPKLQQIDTYYTRNDYPKWKYWFEGLIKLRARLNVGFLTPPYWMYVVESFYDAGMRRGDWIFLANARLAYSLTWETDEVQRKKLINLMYGGIVISQAEWIGDYGQMLRNGFIKAYINDTDFRCLAFDSAMLLLHGIEFTIQKGQNVKDYEVINTNIRKQKFTGCSGTISIEPGGNQRSLPTIGIHNLKWDESSGKIYEDLVGEYDFSSAQLITFYKAIVWYDNTTNVPVDIIEYENGCPFPTKIIFRSDKGSGVLYGISSALIVISIIEALFMWKKFWSYLCINKLTIQSWCSLRIILWWQ